jgi:TRAP-type C4-dicarboxylate transport system permease small subunit
MGAIDRVVGAVSRALAVLGILLLAAVLVAIVYDVTVRSFRMATPRWTVAASEYALHYVAMLGGPYLVRTKGHILVESLMLNIGAALRRWIEIAGHTLCIALCLFLAWISLGSTIEAFRTNDMDLRAFDMPRWLLLAAMPLCFALMAVELVPYLLGRDTLIVDPAKTETL